MKRRKNEPQSGLLSDDCPVCLTTKRNKPGKGRHKASCDDCYPVYRRSYNLLSTVRYRADSKDIPCDLDLSWVLHHIQQPCPMLGVQFDLAHAGSNYGSRHPLCPSIDKIDPHGGYTKDNCRIVSWWYNVAKQQFTDEDVLDLAGLLLANTSKNPGKVRRDPSAMSVW